jgi:hypothetical protein
LLIPRKELGQNSKRWTVVLIVLATLSLGFLVFSGITLNVYASSLGLESLPSPFVTQSNVINATVVVASSTGHGPCSGSNTMDVMGAVMVGAKLGLKSHNGTLETTMDDYVSIYDFGAAKVQLNDLTSNLIVVGGPGVNQITWYYNNLRNASGQRILPVYFDKFPNGTDYIYVAATNHYYMIEHDAQGRATADYGIIEYFQDGGRQIMLLGGLGGSGTWASCEVVSTFESWNLHGSASIVRYSDTNNDGFLDSLSIVEQSSGTINLSNLIFPLPFALLSAAIVPKLKILKKKIISKRRVSEACIIIILAAASQISMIAFSNNLDSVVFTLGDFTHPFVASGGLMNSTVSVASSVGHGPCGGSNTMDVMGGVMIAAQLGIDATGGQLSSTLDDYVSSYNYSTGQLNISALTSNLIVVGGPGVNQITWYYNNLRNASGQRILPVYFDKFPNGTDYIYVAATNHYYMIEHDAQGRATADYGIVTLYDDTVNGWWVLTVAGLGGSGTYAAARLLASYKNWSLFGQTVVVKYSDSNADGYLDTITVPEVIGTGKSIHVYWDTSCMNPVESINWGTLSPGDTKNVTVYVRNEGESSTMLALNVSGWTPQGASNYLSFGWNYSGTPIPPGQVVPINLVMTVNPSISGIDTFGMNFTVSSG